MPIGRKWPGLGGGSWRRRRRQGRRKVLRLLRGWFGQLPKLLFVLRKIEPASMDRLVRLLRLVWLRGVGHWCRARHMWMAVRKTGAQRGGNCWHLEPPVSLRACWFGKWCRMRRSRRRIVWCGLGGLRWPRWGRGRWLLCQLGWRERTGEACMQHGSGWHTFVPSTGKPVCEGGRRWQCPELCHLVFGVLLPLVGNVGFGKACGHRNEVLWGHLVVEDKSQDFGCEPGGARCCSFSCFPEVGE